MDRRNRLTPFGELVAVPDRGTLWGNRGQLLDRHGDLARHHTTRGWVICLLEFKGWRRTQWQPGRLTELFLLDEPTGLAAGHRPCGLCRRADHDAFKAAWAAAHPGTDASAPHVDAVLHRQRLAVPPTHEAPARDLPDGTMVVLGGAAWLVHEDALHRWTPGGYAERRARPHGTVAVQTPEGTVAALRAGYATVPHPSVSRRASP